MGQYYKFIILADNKKNNKEVILLVINPHNYKAGLKIMEHTYLNTDMMNTIEYLLCPYGNFHKSRIVWAGDYADEEEGYDEDNDEGSMNLYRLADNYESYSACYNKNKYNYIVNHTKKLYVNKNKTT